MPQLTPFLASRFSPLAPPPAALPYNPALSLWLSVDPLSDKYPNLSPYVYCADNPVRLVDKDGREVGNYYDICGNYLGTDGQNDFMVHIVTDKSSQIQLKQDSRNGKYTTASINTAVSATCFTFNEIENVFNRTVQNGGLYEEASSTILGDGGPIKRYSTGSTHHIWISSGKYGSGVSIHSHPFGEDMSGQLLGIPELPSESDLETFKGYRLNVIVGKSQCDRNMNGCVRHDMACFYDNSSDIPLLKMEMSAVKKINEHYSKNAFHLPNSRKQ